MSETRKKGRRALVIGGGIGGLAAAIVLGRHFDDVTLVEQDRYEQDPVAVRPHALHGAHVHVLLAGGLVALTRLVPELSQWFAEIDQAEGDLTHHTRVAFEGRWLPKARSGIPIRVCTRGDVEHFLRRSVEQRKNIQVLDNCKVDGLLGQRTIRGARVVREGVSEEITADLVVDATGRGSASLQWLKGIGLPLVEERILDAGIMYSSMWFEPPTDIDDDWGVLATLPSIPKEPRMGVAVRARPDRMLCSTVDYGKIKSPRTVEEFIDRMQPLCVPELHRLVRKAKPLSEPVAYGNTKNRWRLYGKLPWFPNGFVAVGDAVCSMNPRYGQGMTLAALGVAALDRELEAYFATHQGLDGFPAHFQKKLDKELVVPWQIALMEDRAWVSTIAGARPSFGQSLALRGSRRVLEAAFSDVEVYIAFMRVAQLLDPPTSMMTPHLIAKLIKGAVPKASANDDAPRVGAGA